MERRRDHWLLENEDRTWSLRAKRLVLSGTLLAHPRSLKMLAWDDVPLRTAVAKGVDDELDKALSLLQHSQAEVRWNLMVDLGVLNSTLKSCQLRSGWTTPPKRAGGWNASCCSRKAMDAGGLWCMDWIPGKQSRPKARGTCWLRSNSAWWSCCPNCCKPCRLFQLR